MAKDRITGVARPDWDGTAFFFSFMKLLGGLRKPLIPAVYRLALLAFFVCVFDITVVLLSSLYSAP